MTREIRVTGLSHKRAKQGCPHLSWIMFHKICGILRCIHTSEGVHNKRNSLTPQKTVIYTVKKTATDSLTKMVVYKPPFNKTVRVKQLMAREEARSSLEKLMAVPPDLVRGTK